AGHGAGGADLRTAVWQLLPTPRASDGVKGCPAQRGSKGDLTLPSAAVRLDTTRASDGTSNPARTDNPAGADRLLPTPRVAATGTTAASATTHAGPAGSRPQGQPAGTAG